MKKQLLFGSALVTAFAVNAQNHRVKPTGIVKAPKPNELSYSPVEPTMSSSTGSQNQTPALLANKEAVSSGTVPTTWQAFAASQNVFGHLVPNSRIINYDENLDVVSYIYRKPCSYTISPISESNSGAILAKIIRNWNPIAVNGTFQPQYDSTAFGSDATNLKRYPQGGIYNPPGNTNINNAYIVGCGPTTGGSGWTGNWFSSKQLGSANYNNIPSTTPNAQQWVPNPPGSNPLKGMNFNRYNFSITDDGLVRSVATVGTDNPGASQAAPGDTSLYITTGTFAGGTFSWTGTELYPDFQKAPSDGTTNMQDVLMAWNEAGTVGYAIVIGQNKTTTVTVNRGIQPRVWKTTNSGASWAAIPNMDFASPSLTMVTNDLPAALSVNNAVAVPWFRSSEGMDAVVDKDDRLHFVSTVVSHSSVHPDSTYFIFSFNTTDRYYFPHVPGARPYIYDFTTTGTTWSVRKIDSLSTEAPRGSAAAAGSGTGYTENPWTEDASSKPVSSSRIQLGRTVNGNQIYYSWAESDTLITNGNKKWNTFPNVKVRILDVATNSLSPEFNITSPATSLGTNNTVKNRAFFHYTSPKSPNLAGSFAGNYTLAIPASVTNNQSLNGSGVCSPETPVIHFFNAATITNAGVIYVNPTVGINERSKTLTNMQVIPNPASNNANLVFDMLTDAKVLVSVTDVTGKVVKSLTANSTLGQNTININVADLTAGIYFVSISANNQKTTAKLIVE
jgi:hypothetical protein